MSNSRIDSSTLSNTVSRREFAATLLAAVAGGTLSIMPGAAMAERLWQNKQALTVQQVIDLILKSIPNAPFAKTVDTIKSGDPDQKLTGIVTTMFATDEVIEKAAKLGANFIIAHEPTFYNHADDTKWLENDEVYRYKADLLKKHKMAVWRFHDYIHSHKPDGVLIGILTALGWEKLYNADNPYIIKLDPTPFADVTALVKNKLGIPHVRIIGDKKQLCSKIAIAPGAAGGTTQIKAIQKEKPDLFIVGELNEWETSEYIRDLQFMGSKTALLVLGHIVSEEPGLQWLAGWLQPQIPGIKVTHIPTTDAFTWA